MISSGNMKKAAVNNAMQKKTVAKPVTKPATKKNNIKVKDTEMKLDLATRKEKQEGIINKIANYAKIDTIPKDVASSIPITGILQNGIIETKPGSFTKSFKLHDVNFRIAPEEDQYAIYRAFMDFLNSFSSGVRWEFTIFTHKIDKRVTMEKLKIKPFRDGLNKYRNEMNNILLDNLSNGSNSMQQEKYLTVSIDDNSIDHANQTLKNITSEVEMRVKKITKRTPETLSAKDRMKLLFNIYNQDDDYRLASGIYDGEQDIDLKTMAKQGKRFIDLIGPAGMEFNKDSFTLGTKYGRVLYLKTVPNKLSTEFIGDICDMQVNCLTSVTMETIAHDKATTMVQKMLGNIATKSAELQMKNSGSGYFGDVSPEIKVNEKAGNDLLSDLTENDQNAFLVTFTVCLFADSMDELNEETALVKNIGSKYLAPLKITDQQEFALKTVLPLARNDMFQDILLTTESASIFIPFSSQELQQENAVFYGLSQTTKSMITYNRTSGDNYNSLIFGYAGSGKSFTAKNEMAQIRLRRPMDAQIFVIDPQGEYWPLAQKLKGENIKIQPGSNVYINPLDMDISEGDDDEYDPVTTKIDSVISMIEIMNDDGCALKPICRTIIDRILRKLYKPYIAQCKEQGVSCDPDIAPTLTDLYDELRADERDPEAQSMANILEIYTVGSFNTFAHRSTVKTNNQFTVYDIKSLGSGMKKLGLHICINDILNRMIANSHKGIYTYFYIDEFHLLLQSPTTVKYVNMIWRMARKWKGCSCGITQNTEDLLRDANSRNIVNNTAMTIMLKEPKMDRENLRDLYGLSETQIGYINGSDQGQGLIYNGKTTLPFALNFPKNTKLYEAMTTKGDVEGAMFS